MHKPWFQTLATILLIAVLTYLFFWRLWAASPADRAYLPEKSDLAEVFYPPRYYFAKTLVSGQFALWNPHVYAGYPQFADPQAATFYPIALLMAWLNGAGYSMNSIAFDIGLHFFLVGVFTFLFFRHIMGATLPALVGALVFEFGGYLTYYPPLQLSELEVVAWFPLTLLLVSLSIERRSWWLTAVAGATMGIVFLAGRPQSYLTIGSVSIAWLLYSAHNAGFSWGQITRRVILFGLFALGIAAAQWMPTLELTRLSTRSILTYADVSVGGFPFEQLTGFFTPQLFGTQNLYVGLIPLLLAGLALTQRKGLFWGGVFLVCFFGSVGKHLIIFDALYLIERLGFPGYLRNVERLAFGMTFSLAALCGFGLQLIQMGDRRLLRQFLMAAVALFSVTLLFTGLWMITFPPAQAANPRLPADVLSFTGMMLVGGCLALWLFRDNPQATAVVLAGLVIVDVMSVNRGRIFVAESFVPGNDIERVAAAPPGRSTFFRTVLDQTSSQDFGSLVGVDNVGGMPPLMLTDYRLLLSVLDEYRRNLLLNVEVVVTTGLYPDPAFELAAEEDNFRYYHFLVAKPRAYLVQNVISVADAVEAADLLAAPDFDYGNTALVIHDPRSGEGGNGPPSGEPLPLEGEPLSPTEYAQVVGRTANSLTIQVVAEHPRFLVVSDTYYPGWTAVTDDVPTEIYQTNVALRGLVVPPGQHTVTMFFRPGTFYTGVGLTLLTLLGLCVWGGVILLRRRK